jgi:alpha-ketoglutarate-dependent taurine dioxygenase
MNVATQARLNVVRLTPHIGAEVRDIDLRKTLDASTIEAIHQAWLDHAVVVFRNQELSQEDLLRSPAISASSASLPVRPSSFPRVIRGCCPIS